MNDQQKDLLNCDIETGICEIPESSATIQSSSKKSVRLLYFTDPICSSCWGIDPQLRKLKQEYGEYYDVEYRMGGLLKSWNEYGGSDVNGPESVAQHWVEAGSYYQMPINGDVWKDDPLGSSYPPSVAFKAAQLQDPAKAELFLRRIKEMVFVESKNITRWEHLAQAAEHTGLSSDMLKADFEDRAEDLFLEDLELAKEWGVRGFPTIYFIDEDDNRFKVYGSKPYEVYEQALLKLLPASIQKNTSSEAGDWLKKYASITTKELAVLSDTSMDEAEGVLSSLENQRRVERVVARTGTLWRVIG